MKYYKIMREYDGVRIFTESTRIMLEKNELFTECEMKRYAIPFEYASIVITSKNNVEFRKGSNGKRVHRSLRVRENYLLQKSAESLAKQHVASPYGTVSIMALANGFKVHVQTLYTPFYFDDCDEPYVCYIDLEDENGDALETHTTKPDDIEGIAYFVYEVASVYWTNDMSIVRAFE